MWGIFSLMYRSGLTALTADQVFASSNLAVSSMILPRICDKVREPCMNPVPGVVEVVPAEVFGLDQFPEFVYLGVKAVRT